jgi:oligoendopeptidase F
MSIKKREDIAVQYKWNLEDMYKGSELWEADFEQTKVLMQGIESYRGRLGESPETLAKVLDLLEELERKTEKLYVYAKMRRDEDNANASCQVLFERIENLSVQLGSATSFIVPEIISNPEERIRAFMAENEQLKIYEHYFDELMRQKPHILSEKEERLLAMAADLSMASGNIFSMLNNADIKFALIKDEEGKELELTKGRYGRFMESSDRRVRKEAFEALYASYSKLKNTLAATLSSSVRKDIFYARARNYPSALEAALDGDNVSPKVYERLIDSVHNNIDLMYKYIEIRKKILGLAELHMYDIYTPLVKEYRMEIPYEKAKEIVVEALEPLGEEYVSVLQQGLAGGWIDVYENEGKTSGAYSWGCYESHPYVLLNYDNKLDDLFTLAHEMGHSMHSYYSNRNQPHLYSHYSIFVAEVASTVNESLLIDYLLKNCRESQEKLYLLNHYLEQFRGTVFRQTMFAEFERIIHDEVEKGGALNPETLSNIYRELNRFYYGPQMVLDQEIDMEWSRIPHFYSAFYVYKYATGFSAATALKEQILHGGTAALERYLEFLKSGSSDYPVNLLQKAGVDLNSPEPVDTALKYFSRLLKEVEEII